MAILLTLILASFVLLAFRIVRRRKRESYAAIQAGCGEVETFWSKDPLFHMDFTVKSHLDQNLTKRCHAQHGATYLVDSLFDITSLHTIAPENLAALHSQGKEYGVQALRLAGMELFCGHGLLTTDGALWSKSRKMLKPTFDRANISDLGFLDRETDALFAKIEDGTTIDLQEHLFLMVRTDASSILSC
jgi:cytochrome P450